MQLARKCLLAFALLAFDRNIFSSIREYAQQLKHKLEIEKQISIVIDSQNNFQQKWHKILHAL